jgi:hypothetical protein
MTRDNALVDAAMDRVLTEFESATAKFGPFKSRHEGFAVLQEEVDELWQEVKHGDQAAALMEAVQVAAMALRFVVDCC